ncbi:EF-hand_domain pair-containing protein [Hexamita inflata]|uniref:EF-hand domain pair-containing protein n=1 Tax=Hexamita inflata TaxID=28002 RepID=A0AA86RGC0_9EUKA|nr:EF-hand domain pair-containing protein [Hexamita inflata]
MSDATTEQKQNFIKVFQSHDPGNTYLLPISMLDQLLFEANVQKVPGILELELPLIKNETELLSITQFVTLCQKLTNTETLYEIYQNFMQRFDTDTNFTLDTVELKQALNFVGENFTQSEINSMMSQIDFDKDGTMGFEDFRKAIGK